MAEITREVKLDPAIIPPLDESLLTLSNDETEFLHKAITTDDEELKRRIIEVQKDSYQEHAYPCIRGFHFVNLFMSANPVYPEVLAAGKTGNTVFLDLGCCMGTDVRKLVADGYPAARVLGCDLRQEFLDYGYKLYGDKDTCAIHFFASDIFAVPYPATGLAPTAPDNLSGVTELGQLYRSVDHFYTGALFHLFDEATQYALALRVAQLLTRKLGTVVFGRHQGLEEEGYINDHLGRKRYGHSPKSWPLLWKKVFSEVESPEFAENKVVVEAKLSEVIAADVFRARGPTNMLYWSVKIV
ncbi:S-adenosyl-L-methionine-dependent methyltransferase [Phanerochaete sordida]|uniref:S-adenosyl-L-methionine-dependent methyltransferase n=1 Tax=Phanerochaete sordida TaxID=48140 RepID=A0A9P3GCJ4_9APHY|nr:S-adenosyl-L-methionine-dependent methyltransferase [Phanerochaete sordida]